MEGYCYQEATRVSAKAIRRYWGSQNGDLRQLSEGNRGGRIWVDNNTRISHSKEKSRSGQLEVVEQQQL